MSSRCVRPGPSPSRSPEGEGPGASELPDLGLPVSWVGRGPSTGTVAAGGMTGRFPLA